MIICGHTHIPVSYTHLDVYKRQDCDFADDPEPPKRCLFALRECASCGRYYATNKEVEYANALLDQAEHVDAAHARLLVSVCPDCKRRRDAQAASRRSGLGR